MITQKIIARTDSLKLDKIISRYGEDSMRQVVFIIVRPEPDSEELIPITIPEDAVGSFRILKPSGNFVIVPMSKSVLASGETAFDVVLPASASTAKGSGYYDIRITSDTDKYYFTAQGDFLIDDNIISDEVLEDVSEVNGLVFPDDFLTVEDHVAIIDDDTVSAETTWSSDKINDEIEAHAGGDISKTVSGNPLTFTDGAFAPLVKCDVTISPQQDLHGYTKPWVGGSGNNKLPMTVDGLKAENTSGTWSGNTYTLSGMSFTIQTDDDNNVTGILINGSTSAYPSFLFPVFTLEQGTYTISVSSRYRLYDYVTSQQIADTSNDYTLNVTDTTHQYRLLLFTGAVTIADRLVKPIVRISSSSSTWESYTNICHISGYSAVDVNVAETALDTPQTYTINLGGTYYAGQIDAVRGVFVGTHGYDEFDGTANVTISRSGYSNWYYTIANGGYAGANTANVISNKYVGAGVTDNTDVLGIRKQSDGSVRVRVGGTEPADVSGFLAELTDTHLQVVYPIVTPIEIPLTPTVISSLLGNNTMWTDGDNLEVEYITQRFQPLIDSIKQL